MQNARMRDVDTAVVVNARRIMTLLLSVPKEQQPGMATIIA